MSPLELDKPTSQDLAPLSQKEVYDALPEHHQQRVDELTSMYLDKLFKHRNDKNVNWIYGIDNKSHEQIIDDTYSAVTKVYYQALKCGEDPTAEVLSLMIGLD